MAGYIFTNGLIFIGKLAIYNFGRPLGNLLRPTYISSLRFTMICRRIGSYAEKVHNIQVVGYLFKVNWALVMIMHALH